MTYYLLQCYNYVNLNCHSDSLLFHKIKYIFICKSSQSELSRESGRSFQKVTGPWTVHFRLDPNFGLTFCHWTALFLGAADRSFGASNGHDLDLEFHQRSSRVQSGWSFDLMVLSQSVHLKPFWTIQLNTWPPISVPSVYFSPLELSTLTQDRPL